jgi:hypothetical protein
MPMIAAKRGARTSDAKITINETIKTLSFSAGFFRAYNINPENAKFLRIGFDADQNEIGLDFLKKPDSSGEALKLTYTASGTGASCPIRSLLTSFALDAKDVSGIYKNDAIVGPIKIGGFSDEGFILKVNKRQTTRS